MRNSASGNAAAPPPPIADQATDPIIVRSPLPDLTIPDLTVWELIATVAADHLDRVALIDASSGSTVTYGQLCTAVRRTAAMLRQGTVRAGDVVAIVAANSPEWVIAALGVIRAGGIVSAADPSSTSDELAYQLADSGASVVLVTSAAEHRVIAAAASCGGLEQVLLLSDIVPDPAASPIDSSADPTFDSHLDRHPARTEDACLLPYSSGTTGKAKAIRLSHSNLVSNICQVQASSSAGPGDKILAFLPMYHVMGFTVVALAGLAAGATVVTLPAFAPRQFLATIQSQRISIVFVVPPIASLLDAHPIVDEYDLSSLRLLGCGAAPLDNATEVRIADRLGCRVAQGYGMTESSGCISYPLLNAPPRPGSCGALLPNTEAMIIDPTTGKSLDAGHDGELWFRGPQAFSGYARDRQATDEMLDLDGWVHTGDLAKFDEDGFLYITGRLKELIKVNGHQVAPAELEEVLRTHPDVTDAAVVGRPDERAGERPTAYVVTNADVEPIRSWSERRLVNHKRLAAVYAINAIPRTPTGKILRRELRPPTAEHDTTASTHAPPTAIRHQRSAGRTADPET